MKKLGLLFLLFFVQLSYSQATRFIYQVSMKPDSSNKTEVKTELAYLDVSAEKSIFYAENRIKRDSLMQRMRATRNFDRSQMENYRTNIDYTIEKENKTKTITYKQRIARDQYQYEEDRPMVWKILPETSKIDQYKTQKATTEFAGRTWYAWFTMDIPFQDGPYKFSGLPGLIIKVEDQTGDYSFDLKESKKIAELPTFDSRGNVIKVKRKAYEKQLASFQKDPVAFMTASMGSGFPSAPQTVGTGNGGGRGGFQMDPQRIKEFEQRMKEEIKKNNNPIEIIKE